MRDSIRKKAEQLEEKLLSGVAAKSVDHQDRDRPSDPCPVRTAFQHDCHRIVHCKAFRRLRGKTQVFLWPRGDHYRTRLTHCMEVSQIARTLARALRLNEDLTEAIALGHDLGHTPFGHAGEETMERLVPGGFRHEVQSLRVVERLENNGRGLNLTAVVRDGILRHSKGSGPILDVCDEELPASLEGQLVRLSDLIAYVNHDLDDAIRAKVLDESTLPGDLTGILGKTHSERLTNLVFDIVEHSDLEGDRPRIEMGEESAEALEELRAFLYRNVYYNGTVHREFSKAAGVLERLWEHLIGDLDAFYGEWPAALRDGSPEEDVRDFLAGMTDAYAIDLYQKVYTPRRWYVY